jgi:hypothetical protein
MSTLIRTSILLLSTVVFVPSSLWATTIIINNLDDPGVGFNDPTPVEPVGGNTGTTLGEQRMIAFQHAADMWANLLNSSVDIYVDAHFGPLPCTATSGQLGSAGPTTGSKDFTGAPVSDTLYVVALANALSGTDLNGTDAEINANFNGNIGTPGCMESIGFLAGWRGKDGKKSIRGEPNQRQWQMYEQNNNVFHHELPKSYQYMRNWNKGYLHWALHHGLIRYAEPIQIHIYSEVLQKFRLAAQGKWDGKQPPDHLRGRVETYFDPLPFYYDPLEWQLVDTHVYPLKAITQRPMAMYHSWDSQNAWLRQIHTYNHLFVNPQVGISNGFKDGDWVWVESHHKRVRCQCRFSEAVVHLT